MNGESNPYYSGLIEKTLSDLVDLPHQDQVKAFREIQKRLTDYRIEQNAVMVKEINARTEDAAAHATGTNTIASAL